MVKKKTDGWFFVVALILAVIIFLFGLFLGNYIAMSKLNEFKEIEERFLVDLVAFDVKETVLSEDVCKISVEELFEEKKVLGKMMTDLERRFGKENEDVMAKKEIYELIEIKTLQYLKKLKEECGGNFNIVLFFYTNKKGDLKGSVDGCEDQGKVLDQLVYDHNEKGKGNPIYVFAFDINSENLATKALIKKYKVVEVPTMVINGIRYGYLVKSKLKNALD